MAAKKKQENSLVKPKSLFDHIKHIREVQSPNYIETLSEADLKSWEPYMICRFLSMDQNVVDLVNEIQKYQSLPPEHFYKLCIAVTPKGRGYFPYVKKAKGSDYPKEVMDILARHFEESTRNVLEFLPIMGEEQVKKILAMYGKSEKEIDKLVG